MARFMEPFTYHGTYYLVETPGGTFLVVATYVPPDPTADDVEPFQPEGCWCADNTKHQWEITLHEGWYGRLSAPGYMDCTDWEWADTEEELLESLTDDDDDGYDDDDEDEECDEDPRVSPDTAPKADDVPNLDCMSIDPNDLRAYAMDVAGNLTIPTDIRVALMNYAMLKADAMEQRLDGRIPQAIQIESQLETIHRSLPEKYRW